MRIGGDRVNGGVIDTAKYLEWLREEHGVNEVVPGHWRWIVLVLLKDFDARIRELEKKAGVLS